MKVNARRKLWLCGHEITVLFVEQDRDGKETLCGSYDAAINTIYVTQHNRNDDRQRSIFWHELAHAAFSIGYRFAAHAVPNEEGALAVELCMMSLVGDSRNAWAVKFLTGQAKAPRR